MTVGRFTLIWDYDAAIGQINASYPYRFREETILREIDDVGRILALASEFALPMTFAITGFAAEEGHWPYHVPDQIREIHAAGHEVASHSWRHEWFPYLQRAQVEKSLMRSKEILETCIQSPGAVTGFVLPFNRPMSWLRKGAFSLGDRAWGPGFPGSDLGSLMPIVQSCGYRWCRVVFRAAWSKLLGRPAADKVFRHGGVTCIPNQYTGFDDGALHIVRAAAETGGVAVVTGHPSGLSRNGNENAHLLRELLREVAALRDGGRLRILRANELEE